MHHIIRTLIGFPERPLSLIRSINFNLFFNVLWRGQINTEIMVIGLKSLDSLASLDFGTRMFLPNRNCFGNFSVHIIKLRIIVRMFSGLHKKAIRDDHRTCWREGILQLIFSQRSPDVLTPL